MKTSLLSHSVILSVIVASLAVSGCAGMTRRQQNTAAGAAIGGVAGSVLTGGSTTGTLGGAAIGGVIGHEKR